MRMATLFVGMMGSALLAEGNSVGEASAIVKQATEVTQAAAAANKKLEFATAGVYAIMSKDAGADDQTRKGFEKDLRGELLHLPKLKADTKAEAPEEVRKDIEESLDKLELMRALDGVGRLTAMHSIEAIAPLNMEKLKEAVHDIAGFCPKCAGTKSEVCLTCKGGPFKIKTQCKRCINGMHACETCSGSKWVKCKSCGGDGNADFVRQQSTGGAFKERVKKTVPCTACARWWTEHAGSVPCKNCADGQKPCNTCKTTGEVEEKGKCPDCGAKGKLSCSNCNSTGKRPS